MKLIYYVLNRNFNLLRKTVNVGLFIPVEIIIGYPIAHT